MQTVSTVLILGAKDQASGVLNKVGQSVNRVEGKIVNVGESMQGAQILQSEWLRSLLGPELTTFADNAFNATEAVTALGEASQGTAIIMKAGLIGAVGIGAFKLGEWMSGIHEEMKAYRATLMESEKIARDTQTLLTKDFAFDKFKISLIPDSDQQLAALEELSSRYQKEISDIGDQLATMEEKTDRTRKISLGRLPTTIRGSNQARALLPELEANLKNKQMALEATKARASDLTETIRRLNAVEEARAKYASPEKEKAKAKAISSMADAYRNMFAEFQRGVTKQLETENRMLTGLKQTVIQLRDGEAAARDYRLALRGDVSSFAKKQAAALNKEIDNLKQRNALQDEAKRIIEGNKTSFEKLTEQAGRAKTLFENGLLDQDQFDRQIAALKEGLTADVKGGSGKPADLQAKQSRFLSGRGSKQAKDPAVAEQRKLNSNFEAFLKAFKPETFEAMVGLLKSIEQKTTEEEVLR